MDPIQTVKIHDVKDGEIYTAKTQKKMARGGSDGYKNIPR